MTQERAVIVLAYKVSLCIANPDCDPGDLCHKFGCDGGTALTGFPHLPLLLHYTSPRSYRQTAVSYMLQGQYAWHTVRPAFSFCQQLGWLTFLCLLTFIRTYICCSECCRDSTPGTLGGLPSAAGNSHSAPVNNTNLACNPVFRFIHPDIQLFL